MLTVAPVVLAALLAGCPNRPSPPCPTPHVAGGPRGGGLRYSRAIQRARKRSCGNRPQPTTLGKSCGNIPHVSALPMPRAGSPAAWLGGLLCNLYPDINQPVVCRTANYQAHDFIRITNKNNSLMLFTPFCSRKATEQRACSCHKLAAVPSQALPWAPVPSTRETFLAQAW